MVQGSRRAVPWIRFVPFLVLLFFLVTAFVYREGLEARVTVGAPAPDFTLSSLDGNEIRLADLEGRPVILNFWTTWCRECRIEAPVLEAFHRKHGERVVLVGVNMREPAGVVRPFVNQYEITYPILLDRSERVANTYRVSGVPETWFIDSDGTALGRHVGPMTLAQLEQVAGELQGAQAGSAPGETAASSGEASAPGLASVPGASIGGFGR